MTTLCCKKHASSITIGNTLSGKVVISFFYIYKASKVSQNIQEDEEHCLEVQDGTAACGANMNGSTGSQDINENEQNKTYTVEDLLQKVTALYLININ